MNKYLVLICCVLLAACSAKEEAVAPATNNVANSAPSSVSESVVSNREAVANSKFGKGMLDGCAGPDAQESKKAKCECILNVMADKYTVAELNGFTSADDPKLKEALKYAMDNSASCLGGVVAEGESEAAKGESDAANRALVADSMFGKSLMNGCMAGSTSEAKRAKCECSMNILADKYSAKELNEMPLVQGKTEQVMKYLTDNISSCK